MKTKTFDQLRKEGKELNDICFKIFDNFDGLMQIRESFYAYNPTMKKNCFHVKWGFDIGFYTYDEDRFLNDLMYYENFTKEQSLLIIEKMKG